ncbi:MAG: hypothetical protein HZC45_05570 [Deltaproteobacteria bacterium]|nr:hypothetical protein [Deltaproteobacteria bacterium]
MRKVTYLIIALAIILFGGFLLLEDSISMFPSSAYSAKKDDTLISISIVGKDHPRFKEYLKSVGEGVALAKNPITHYILLTFRDVNSGKLLMIDDVEFVVKAPDGAEIERKKLKHEVLGGRGIVYYKDLLGLANEGEYRFIIKFKRDGGSLTKEFSYKLATEGS